MSIELLQNEPKRRQGGVRDYISPSRLNCWLACPLKFRARYIDGIRSPTTPSLFLGKQVHAALEHFYRHRMLGVTLQSEEVVARIDATWQETVAEEEIEFASTAEETKLREQATRLVEAYLRQRPAEEPRPQGVEVTMETPLIDPATGEDLGVPLLGIVDLIAGGDEGPTITDFKTAARSAPPFDVTHEIQLTAYSYLFRQLEGVVEGGLEIRSLVKTKTPKIDVHAYPPRTDVHFRRFFAVVREYLDALDAGRFNFRPGFGCAMCDLREDACRAWSG